MEGDNKVKRKQKNKIPTTVIESIPYMQVYENGMIEIVVRQIFKIVQNTGNKL